MDLTDAEEAIVIAGRRDDWPGGPRTLAPRQATREANGTLVVRRRTRRLDDSGDQVWSRIDKGSIGRMPDKTPEAKGRHLIDALLAHIKEKRLSTQVGLNRFDVRVSNTGDTWIERLRW